VAVIGSGIAGMSAAWLLHRSCEVTVYEAGGRPGGHSCTVDAPAPGGGAQPVDMGFIVYNEATYPNLTALFAHLGVETRPTCMSLGMSLDGGRLEYGSRGLGGFVAQPGNLVSRRFWSMLSDLARFYRTAPAEVAAMAEDDETTLGDYLASRGYGEAFRDDHILPEAAAIWSLPAGKAADYPVKAFVRFFENHGLLKFVGRPRWRTVVGGARAYVDKLTAPYRERIRTGARIAAVERQPDGVVVRDRTGWVELYDEVVLATHPDQALALLDEPSGEERALLGAIRYGPNRAILHGDPRLMPRRRAVWSSWNYMGRRGSDDPPSVSYWMNQLQDISGPDLFVSLNPQVEPRPGTVVETKVFEHPIFDSAALSAQRRLWSLQGVRRTWFCGAWFGSGFHEDGLQAGLAVAEAIGGVRRPWTVPDESGRIALRPAA
jgi:predicted NAD/FAD-binding protein